MRIYPIDVTIALNVCASSFEEAVDAVKRGLNEGRYTGDAKFFFAQDRYKDEHGMTEKERLVKCMDLAGWEQDGEGLDFINPATGQTRHFDDLEQLDDFMEGL